MSYGCYNRKPLQRHVTVQDGWYAGINTRTARMVTIPDPMTKDCQYQKDDRYADPQCVGCKHNLRSKT